MMEIIITYDKMYVEDYRMLGGDVERTIKSHVEVYTLPVVAMARVRALNDAGIYCTITNKCDPIIVCE